MPERIIYNLGGLVTWWQIIKSIPLNSYEFLPIFYKFLSIKNNSKILDVGTGLGYIARLLYAQKKSIDITGIDINKRLIKLATKESCITKQKIKYAVMDAYSLKFPGAFFDLVIEQTVLIITLAIK